jgi:hypothetical protein
MTRYHRAHCPLVAGKRIRVVTKLGHGAAALEPCGVCQPARSPAEEQGSSR